MTEPPDVAHRRRNADAVDDGSPSGRLHRRLLHLQIDFQVEGDDEAEDALCDLLDLWPYPREVIEQRHRLRVREGELRDGSRIEEGGVYASGSVRLPDQEDPDEDGDGEGRASR